jgi:hypothetical protein
MIVGLLGFLLAFEPGGLSAVQGFLIGFWQVSLAS